MIERCVTAAAEMSLAAGALASAWSEELRWAERLPAGLGYRARFLGLGTPADAAG